MIGDGFALPRGEAGELDRLKRWIYNARGGEERTPVLDALNHVFKTSKKEEGSD